MEVFCTSNNSLVLFIVINHMLISDLFIIFIAFILFIFIVSILLLCIALHCSYICTLLCIALHISAYICFSIWRCMPLHIHFPITYLCICIFTCIAYPCIFLSHFTYIKELLGTLATQAYKPQVVPFR